MIRSLKKGPNISINILEKLQKLTNVHEQINVWDRSCTILPVFVGKTLGVYNGKKHIPVYITENMIGHKLGEFALTRKFIAHKNLDKKNKKKIKN